MKLTKIALTAIVAAAVVTPALQANAADSSKDTGVYMKMDAGVNIMQDATGKSGAGSAKIPMDMGFRVGLIGGYDLAKWAAIELETGFLYNGFKDSGSTWFGAVPVLANLVFRYENDSKFVPYIGAGAGGAWTMVEGNSMNESTFVFAYQAKAGVAYEISPSMSVDVGYKFFSTAEQKYTGLKVTDVYCHFIGLGFTYKF